MSPLLEISLFIVAIFWTIPLCWAVCTFVRSIPDRTLAMISYFYSLPDKVKRSRENAQFKRNLIELTQKEKQLDSEYQILQERLIEQRAIVEDALKEQNRLFSRVRKVSGYIDDLNSRAAARDISERQRQYLSTCIKELARLRSEVSAHDEFVSRRRDELTELEEAVQKKYTQKQVQIAMDKADAACREVNRLLVKEPKHLSALTRMEVIVNQKEAEIYGKFLLEDQYVSFPSAAKSLERLSLEMLDLGELKELFEAADQSASELCRILHSAVSYERVLTLQAESEQDPEQFLRMIEASKICTQEFMRMHEFFAEKEREIFMRISSLEPAQATEGRPGE